MTAPIAVTEAPLDSAGVRSGALPCVLIGSVGSAISIRRFLDV